MKNTLLRYTYVAALACGLSSLAAPAAAGDLKLTMQNGRVTIIADNVPLRQILQEWARIGKTTIVNADKMIGPAISLQLIDAPERDALDILLRSASGYIAAPRPVPVADASFYDRVTIMATSRAPAATSSTMSVPTFQRPPAPTDDTDEPVNMTMPPAQGFPVNGQFPGGMPPQQPGANVQPPNAAQPGMPAGPIMSPRPGVVPPPPQTPATYPNPYQPNQPNTRPPGLPMQPTGRGGGPGGF